MKIYKLFCNSEDFAILRLTNKGQRRLFYTIEDFQKIEGAIEIGAMCDVGKNAHLADLSYFGGSVPFCFSLNAYLLLQNFLDEFGVIKEAKVECKDEAHYIFWPSNKIDCLDKQRSEIFIMPSGHKDLVKPVFIKEKLCKGQMFIVSQKFQLTSLFITEDIAEILTNSDLTGYILEEV